MSIKVRFLRLWCIEVQHHLTSHGILSSLHVHLKSPNKQKYELTTLTITMDKPLTTANVPPQFLKSAYLVGHIPQTVLQSDKRLSYSLYIPPQHYHAKGEIKLPLLVSIHGTRRDLSPLHTDLEAFANTNACAVLAPLFPAGLEGPNDVDSYKTLKSQTLRSDLALLDILDAVAER